jgi:hypothetical protein
LVLAEAQTIAHCLRDTEAVDQTPIAGTGIGLSGIGHHGTNTTGRHLQTISTKINAGGADNGCGEGACTDCILWCQQKREVSLSGWLETRA